MKGKRAVFLDRDGVIIEEVNYLSRPDQVRLLPGVADAIARLNLLGFPVVVVTNQAGVARGFFSESEIPPIHKKMVDELARSQAKVDGIYFCPHHPEGVVAKYSNPCQCRKPKPGLLHQAAKELNLQMEGSWLIGDNITDMEAGLAAGCGTILVLTGHGKNFRDRVSKETVVAGDLSSAVEILIRSEKNFRKHTA